MDEFGDLTRDLGIRQQGKSAPMSASKPSSSCIRSRSANPVAVNGIFSGYKDPNSIPNSPLNSMRVYDDNGICISTSKGGPVEVNDLLGVSGSGSKKSEELGGFEEFMDGFGGSSPTNQREPEASQQKSAVSSEKSSADVSEDPFVVFESTSSSAHPSQGMSTNPLEELGRSTSTGSSNVNASSVNGGIILDNGAFDASAKPVLLFTSEQNESRKGNSPLESSPSSAEESSSRRSFNNAIPRTRPTKSFDSSSVQSPTSNSPYRRNGSEDYSLRPSEYLERADDAWLTVAEIPLFTEPTRGPPPSRKPPPLPMKPKPYVRADLRRKRKENKSYSPCTSSNLYPKGSEFSELEKDEETTPHAQDLEYREQREREERDRDQKILENERGLEREKVARAKAERAAVDKANAEARRRADRAAAQRAATEARERAFAEAQERAARERINAEAREKAIAEARLRAERERAAAAAAREKQYKAENDLESFFGLGAHPTSAPKERATTSGSFFDSQAQSRGGADGEWRTSSASSKTRKTSSTTYIVDDLTSIFGGSSSSGEFQEVEGESEDRRRARFEKHQRMQERTMKALADKNERDKMTQMEQAEKHRISETLDMEIRRWAYRKEGNLRALLSSLQDVLWPECGWQPVGLADLITSAAVKKVYRKATLCIHPDKVQQKGANLQQKCIAEKVFDILKEAWNKFNSEELS